MRHKVRCDLALSEIKHQVSCEVAVVVVSFLIQLSSPKPRCHHALVGPHHLAEGCEFVFTEALMNCGLCGLNESVPLLSKGTWEDNKSSQFTNVSLAAAYMVF